MFTPNPIAVGIPTDGDPILIDVSASITTNGMADRLRREGKRFPGPVGARRRGPPDRRPGGPVRRPARDPAAGRRDGPRAQGVRAGPAGRGPDPGAGRVRPGRGADRVGGVGVRPGDRPGGVRRARRVPAGDRVDGGRLPRQPAGPRRGRRPAAGPARARRKRRALADGVALYPGVMAALAPTRGSSA